MARRRKTVSTPDGGRGWAEYVQSHLDALGWTNAVLAQRAELDRSLIGRWLNEGIQPTNESVKAVCYAFNTSIPEALVAAGMFTADEILADPPNDPDLRFVDDDSLLDEVRRRIQRSAPARQDEEAPSVPWSGVTTEVSTQSGHDVGETHETRLNNPRPSPRVPTSGSNGP